MLKRFVLPFAVAACSSFALAQTETTNKQPPKEATPAKTIKKAPTTESKEITLKVGDPAPSLTGIEKFVKGEPVTGFEKGRVYVVEFWATWCVPCIKTIPHLTELQKKHKELTVIGVTSSERKPKEGDPDNRLANLEKFVEKQGEKMDYRVAYDADRDVAKAWLEAAGQGFIPTAFVVDAEGKISWIGSPSTDRAAFDNAVETALSKSKQEQKGVKKKEEQTTDAKRPSPDNKDKK